MKTISILFALALVSCVFSADCNAQVADDSPMGIPSPNITMLPWEQSFPIIEEGTATFELLAKLDRIFSQAKGSNGYISASNREKVGHLLFVLSAFKEKQIGEEIDKISAPGIYDLIWDTYYTYGAINEYKGWSWEKWRDIYQICLLMESVGWENSDLFLGSESETLKGRVLENGPRLLEEIDQAFADLFECASDRDADHTGTKGNVDSYKWKDPGCSNLHDR